MVILTIEPAVNETGERKNGLRARVCTRSRIDEKKPVVYLFLARPQSYHLEQLLVRFACRAEVRRAEWAEAYKVL